MPEVTDKDRRAYQKKLDEIAKRHGQLEESTVRQSIQLLKDLRSRIAGVLTDAQDFEAFRLRELQNNIDSLIGQYEAQLQQLTQGAIQQSYDLGGRSAVEPMQAVGFNNVFFRPSQAQINTLLDFSADLIQGIGMETRRKINNQIRIASLGETSTFQTMKDITKILYGSERIPTAREPVKGIAYEAERILRTETNRVYNLSNYAQLEEMAKVIPDLRKKWIATADARTRLSHLNAHGQTVLVSEQFTVGGEKLKYPLDPAGSAKNTINCRCKASGVIPEAVGEETALDEKIAAEKARRELEKPTAKYRPMAEAEALADYKAWADALSLQEKQILNGYRARNYKSINGKLRDGTTADWESIAEMDRALSRNPLTRNMELYRGASVEALGGLENISVGYSFSDAGYTSTSLSKSNAARFAVFAEDEGQTPVFITVRAPQGTAAAYLEALGNFQGEQEMLLGRGGNYMISDVTEITESVYGRDRTMMHIIVDLIP